MNRPAGPGSAPGRTASRSLLATVEITAMASLAHVLAGGRLPTPGFLLAFAAVVFGSALLSVGRVLRVGAVVPFVLLCQVGLHASLDGVHAHAGAHAADASFLALSAPMVWAHLVTTVVTAIVLLLQERVLAAAVAALRVLGPVPALAGPARPLTLPVVRAGRQVLLATSPRRGPPRLHCATS